MREKNNFKSRRINFEYTIIMKENIYKKEFHINEISDGEVEYWRIELAIENYGKNWQDAENFTYEEYIREYSNVKTKENIEICEGDIFKIPKQGSKNGYIEVEIVFVEGSFKYEIIENKECNTITKYYDLIEVVLGGKYIGNVLSKTF
jgi:hypothetical protein